MALLGGLSYDKAHLFGLPHLGCRYTHGDRYELLDGEPCVVCGRPARNCHHVVPRSVRKVFRLGAYELRSPLFALCGSGTTGCHDGFHGGRRYVARWEWDVDESLWWDGTLLDRHGPHSDELFGYGRYVIDAGDREILIGGARAGDDVVTRTPMRMTAKGDTFDDYKQWRDVRDTLPVWGVPVHDPVR